MDISIIANNTNAGTNVCWDEEDEKELERLRSEPIELYETEVGRQVEGQARGTVLVLKGKTKEEVKQYLTPDTYEFFSEFFNEKALTTATTMTTAMTKRVKCNLFKI